MSRVRQLFLHTQTESSAYLRDYSLCASLFPHASLMITTDAVDVYDTDIFSIGGS